MRSAKTLLVAGLILFLALPALNSQARLNENLLNGLTYRNLGPFRAGAWINDIAVPERPQKAHLYTFYVAARNGGVWKTTNGGTTFEPVFDGQNVSSIGCLAIAPSNSNVVWVGTGDAQNARSSYAGDGVYRSDDGGKTWRHMGLADSHHIARIVIDPANPEIVYIAAMGHLFTPNAQRGIFKSVDGGRTWNKVLYINDKIGVIDLVMDRRDPKVLYAATYEKERLPWRMTSGGPESGIYKTTDAGRTWHRLAGGLPVGKIGRIGLALYQKNPQIVYAIVENANQRRPTEDEARQDRARNLQPQPRDIGGEIYRSNDAGRTWRKMNAATDDVSGKAAYSFNQIRVDPNNPERIFVTGIAMGISEDGGRNWSGLKWPPNGIFRTAFGDFRTFWIDPQNSDRMLAGSDGGVFVSYDGGKTCDHFLNLKLGEFYSVAVDMESPYNVYGGLQDHESWKGPSRGRTGAIGIEDWVTIGTGDGMYNQVDPEDSRWVYNTAEFGQHARLDQKTGERKRIMPARGSDEPPLRFNWVAPLKMSPHNPQIIYTGAQVLLRSMDRGEHWQEISPDLTTNDPKKISAPGTSIQFCTITTIAESPLAPGLLWVGTDDGKVQVTRNDGGAWTDVTANLVKAGAPEDAWVTRVFASSFTLGTAYVTKSRWRQDDYRPFVFVTRDYGATWTSLSSNLPAGSVNVIAEDPVKPNVLFVGTDRGVFVSNNAGKVWVSFRANMPVVPVQDLLVHPRDGELVAATYGRGAWIADITPLRDLTDEVLAKEIHLFPVKSRPRMPGALGGYRLYGNSIATTPNDPEVTFTYYLRAGSKEKVRLTVAEPDGSIVRELQGEAKAGLNRAGWDLSDMQRRPVDPGPYIVTMQVGQRKYTQDVEIRPPTPAVPAAN